MGRAGQSGLKLSEDSVNGCFIQIVICWWFRDGFPWFYEVNLVSDDWCWVLDFSKCKCIPEYKVGRSRVMGAPLSFVVHYPTKLGMGVVAILAVVKPGMKLV